MTKLDRAFDEYNEEENQEKLLEMSQQYQARNISATDLFEILKKVTTKKSAANNLNCLNGNHSINQECASFFLLGCTSLLRHDAWL